MNQPSHDAAAQTMTFVELQERDALARGASAAESALAAGGDGAELPGGRYRVVGEIARGGMGVVLRAVDAQLQRPLAVKVMLPRLDASGTVSAGLVDRFLEEARITGQLQHPGIAPVHEIGRLEDGRPFFSMKLIEGRTLAGLLGERPSPQADVPRFLKVFEQIAQTLAYAHSRGIIHRDLKPQNVMVGAFGEVQVMDWGLAKRLGGPAAEGLQRAGASAAAGAPPAAGLEGVLSTKAAAGASAETVLHTDDGDRTPPYSASRTQAGQALGTPAYMPPEQARGQIDAMDARSDVFGLGAILCEILTGAPPFAGGDGAASFRRAKAADLSETLARIDACGADGELVALCRECLAAEPSRRPADAGAVALRTSDYLASVQERLQKARVERAAAEVQVREERKRRRLAVLLAAAVVVFLVSAAVATTVFLQNKARDEGDLAARKAYLVQETTAALDDAQRLRKELHDRLGDPLEAARLMSDLNQWQGLLLSAEAAWKRADALAAGGRELLPPEIHVRRSGLQRRKGKAGRAGRANRPLADPLSAGGCARLLGAGDARLRAPREAV